jgi:predicted SAM-dependent methyltransferase
MINDLLSVIGNKPLRKLLEKQQQIKINLKKHSWVDAPPSDFLEFVRATGDHDAWQIPAQKDASRQPNFFVSQVHRAWVTSSLLHQNVSPDDSIVDLGSFPFVIPITMRGHFMHKGAITASVIQGLSSDTLALLQNMKINSEKLDLDPYVHDLSRCDDLPKKMQLPDGSQDACTLFHVVEHLYHPMSILRECHRMLRPGGALILTTDNANMLNVLQNVVSDYGYVFEPVESTAAMAVHDWRGHVRFFTRRDLTVMLEHAGFKLKSVEYREVFYDKFFPEYFKVADPEIAEWRIKILEEFPQFRNEIMVVGVKQ